MTPPPVLAAVDLGSNSFRLQFGQVEHGQLTLLDSLRIPVRLAAGLDADHNLDEAARQRALDCLHQFRELIAARHPERIRVVGTHTLRVAGNSDAFLHELEAALGQTIEIIPGEEEARLIYLGVAHGLPPSDERRLVVDIGGGSTEFILGQGVEARRLASLPLGGVTWSRRYFPEGRISAENLALAETTAREHLGRITTDFAHPQWDAAYGSAGTAFVVNEVLRNNGYSEEGLTRNALEALREHLIRAGSVGQLDLSGLKPDRVAALPGGFAILYTVFQALGIERMQPVHTALREGLLQDMLQFYR